jgi:hypothetical protein
LKANPIRVARDGQRKRTAQADNASGQRTASHAKKPHEGKDQADACRRSKRHDDKTNKLSKSTPEREFLVAHEHLPVDAHGDVAVRLATM